MGNGVTKGGRDFYEPGSWNLMCAYCGRKRKGNELLRDDEFARGLWCCPAHRDMRHPQDFARGVKEDMTAPFIQPPVIAFTSLPAGFPLFILPSPIVLLAGSIDLTTEVTSVLLTESGIDIVTENAFISTAIALLPPWMSDAADPFGVYVTSLTWSWASGGSGILIGMDPLNGVVVLLQAFSTGLSGVLQVSAINNLGQTAVATAQVNS